MKWKKDEDEEEVETVWVKSEIFVDYFLPWSKNNDKQWYKYHIFKEIKTFDSGKKQANHSSVMILPLTMTCLCSSIPAHTFFCMST